MCPCTFEISFGVYSRFAYFHSVFTQFLRILSLFFLDCKALLHLQRILVILHKKI
jgi:hypothetical protein